MIEIDGARVIHFGDTEAKLDEFEPYLDTLTGADVALLPFWFLTSEWRATMVRERLAPRAIVVAHLPERTAPASYFGRWKSHARVIELIGRDFPSAAVPARADQSWSFREGSSAEPSDSRE